MGANGAKEPSAEQWKSAFAKVRPLIVQEWPSLDEKAIDAAANDLDALAGVIAEKLERTRVGAKKKLSELHSIAVDAQEDRVDKIKSIIDRLEARTVEIRKRVREEMIPKAQTKMKENLLVTILAAIGLGLLVGLLMRGGRRGD